MTPEGRDYLPCQSAEIHVEFTQLTVDAWTSPEHYAFGFTDTMCGTIIDHPNKGGYKLLFILYLSLDS